MLYSALLYSALLHRTHEKAYGILDEKGEVR